MSNVVDFAQRGPYPGPHSGQLWEILNNGSGVAGWKDIAFGRGVFIGCSTAGLLNSLCRTIDGYDWTYPNSAAALQWTGIAYGNGVWNSCAQNGAGNQFQRSIDNGVTWTSVAEPSTRQWRAICWAGGDIWLAVAQDGVGNQFARSIDGGASWASIAEPATLQWASIAANPYTGHVLAITSDGAANGLARSVDYGASWVSVAVPASRSWQTIRYARDRWNRDTFVFTHNVGGANSDIGYSLDDGITFGSGYGATSNLNLALAYGNKRWCTLRQQATNHRAHVSSDSVEWVAHDFVTYGAFQASCMAFGNGRFVALGINATYNVALS
jgi:hypothetical protein